MTDEPVTRSTADRVIDALALVLLIGAAVLGGLFEVIFLAEWYAGTVIIPVTIVAAVAGNVLLPILGLRVLGRTLGAVLPVIGWLVPVLALTLYTRPEGDLFVLGIYYQDTAFYALLLVGAVTGFATVMQTSGRSVSR